MRIFLKYLDSLKYIIYSFNSHWYISIIVLALRIYNGTHKTVEYLDYRNTQIMVFKSIKRKTPPRIKIF